MPAMLLLLLLSCSLVSVASVGYGCGVAGKRNVVLTTALTFLISGALWATIDMDHPRKGLIRVGQQPMLDLQKSQQHELESRPAKLANYHWPPLPRLAQPKRKTARNLSVGSLANGGTSSNLGAASNAAAKWFGIGHWLYSRARCPRCGRGRLRAFGLSILPTAHRRTQRARPRRARLPLRRPTQPMRLLPSPSGIGASLFRSMCGWVRAMERRITSAGFSAGCCGSFWRPVGAANRY